MSVRCAIYTRKSTEEGLEQEFNSLDAQREACDAFIRSQRGLGWKTIPGHYDDGGVSGGTMERPGLRSLLDDVDAGKVDLVVVYKVDRLTRSLADFSRIIDAFDAKDVSFVSVTQQFNTSSSMGRLTLNMLLSFAQFEREVTAERIRDKIAASKRKGMWMGGQPPLGYDVYEKKLVVNETEANDVRTLFAIYLERGSVRELKGEAERLGIKTKLRVNGTKATGGKPFSRGNLYCLLHNPLYVGKVAHKGEVFPGQHKAIVDCDVWDKVQTLLEKQAPPRLSDDNVERQCLLTGIVFDETGDRLCPTYAKKGDRVHAYYVSRRLLQPASETDGGWRLPAKGLEDAISTAIATMLDDGKEWVKLLSCGDLGADAYKKAQDRATDLGIRLRSKVVISRRDVLRHLVHSIAVQPGMVSITFVNGALEGPVAINAREPGFELQKPFHTRRRGVETRLVIGGNDHLDACHDETLIAAVKRSFRWWRCLTEEDGWSVQKLAEKDQVDASDVTRFLPLVFLAPDIVESILEGRQPADLTLERLKKTGPLPMDWEEQRIALGFAKMNRA